ncbi:MAG: hypothetical protein HYS12_26315 [Planctomycetes bacterium]|nr:hypothetical protein [Planctomycetota bacterium]
MRPTVFAARPLMALFAGFVLLSAGCVDFEKQTIVIAFDPDRDAAHALLVYEDLHPGGDKEDNLKDAKQTLDELFAQEKGFILAHPFAIIRVTRPDEKEKLNEQEKKLRALLLKHLTVKKGTFFVNKEGRLCGTQTVDIRGAKKFVEGINASISDSVGEEADRLLSDRTKRGDLDEETLRLWQKAARDQHPWLTYEPGQVKLTLVGSPKYLASVKRELADELLSGLRRALNPRPGEGPQRTPRQEADERERNRYHLRSLQRLADFVAEVPWSVEQKRDRLSLAIGLADGGPLRLFSPYMTQKPGLKSAEMIAHAKKLGLPFQKDATVESVIADFLRKHTAGKSK